MEGMDYLKTAWLVISYIQVNLIILQAQESNYCDRCLIEPTNCRKVSGTFGITVMSKGYNPVVDIPVGACFINVTEIGRSQNYLALKSQRSGYILNGMWRMSQPGTYRGAGTLFQYTRATGSCPGDCIYSKGPSREPFIVMLLYHDVSSGIAYSYSVPHHLDQNANMDKQNEEHGAPSPRDDIASREQLEQTHARSALRDSKIHVSEIPDDMDSPATTVRPTPYHHHTVGGPDRHSDGRRRRPIFSSDFKRPRSRVGNRRQRRPGRRHKSDRESLRDVTYSRQLTDSNEQERPEVTGGLDPAARIINVDSRPVEGSDRVDITIQGSDQYTWRISGYTQCSRSCGGGLQEPVLKCMDSTNNIPVAEQNCQAQIRPESNPIDCSETPCIPNWETGEWTPCSTNCGQGEQTRSVICQQRVSSTVIRNLTAEECLHTKPEGMRLCSMVPCRYHWIKSEWSDCSVLCGSGIRTRHVECHGESGYAVNDTFCGQTKPRTFRSCDLGSCTRHWYYTSWNNLCSEDCVSGTMSRVVHCVTDSGRVLPDDECDSSKRPHTERRCTNNGPCRGHWFTGPWSKCSVSCGEGLRQREAICMKKLQDDSLQVLHHSQCLENEKPDTEEICSQEHCGTLWYMTDWSKCSASCGGGIKQRHIQCLNSEMKYSTLCSDNERPADRASCNSEKCWTRPRPINTGCVDKYPNCAIVVQTRLCRYPYYQRNCCRACSSRG